MTKKNNTDRFLERHAIRVLDTNKRAAKHTRTNINCFEFKEDYNMFNRISTSFEVEPLFTVEIAESELERIAQFEERVFNNMAEKGHYNLFETLMEQKEQERFLRSKYPAVQKAYEQYSLILSLAKSGEFD